MFDHSIQMPEGQKYSLCRRQSARVPPSRICRPGGNGRRRSACLHPSSHDSRRQFAVHDPIGSIVGRPPLRKQHVFSVFRLSRYRSSESAEVMLPLAMTSSVLPGMRRKKIQAPVHVVATRARLANSVDRRFVSLPSLEMTNKPPLSNAQAPSASCSAPGVEQSVVADPGNTLHIEFQPSPLLTEPPSQRWKDSSVHDWHRHGQILPVWGNVQIRHRRRLPSPSGEMWGRRCCSLPLALAHDCKHHCSNGSIKTFLDHSNPGRLKFLHFATSDKPSLKAANYAS